MLGKLLKYDFRSLSRIIMPATLLVIATTVLGTCSMRLIFSVVQNMELTFAKTALLVGLSLIVAASVVAIIAYAIVSVIFVYARFYKNFFTDEGYLTFTLPVKTGTLLFSKVITFAVWSIICSLIAFLMIGLFLLVGTAPSGSFINTDVWSGFVELTANVFSLTPLTFIILILSSLVQMLSEGLMVFLAIAIGSTVANKHKLITSVGFYFALSTALQVIATIVIMIVGLCFGERLLHVGYTVLNNMTPASIICTLMGVTAIFYAVVGIIEFFIINFIIKKKLNLA